MTASHDWDPELYDDRLAFVSDFGSSLIELLQPKPGENVLDIGCGSGDLAARIAEAGAFVLGIDASPDMVAAAREKYAHRTRLDFRVARAESFSVEQQADAAFSNAALHWVKDARSAAARIRDAVKPGGRLVAELGGKGNIDAIVRMIEHVLAEKYRIDAAARNPWYFPSIGEYALVLEATGWEVSGACLFDRPTALDGEDGMHAWLTMFGGPYFSGLPDDVAVQAKADICEALAPQLFDPSTRTWTADYRRLRIMATRVGPQ